MVDLVLDLIEARAGIKIMEIKDGVRVNKSDIGNIPKVA
jgi:hypothetical protein